MFRNNDRSISRNVTGSFLSSFLNNKTSETTKIYIFFLGQRILYSIHQCFNCLQDRLFIHACFLGNLIYNVCFCHLNVILFVILFSNFLECKYIDFLAVKKIYFKKNEKKHLNPPIFLYFCTVSEI